MVNYFLNLLVRNNNAIWVRSVVQKITNSCEEAYDREVYDKFRRQPICLTAVELAQQSDHRAVGLLLTYQAQEALPYWLTSLSNFPETTSPTNYKSVMLTLTPTTSNNI